MAGHRSVHVRARCAKIQSGQPGRVRARVKVWAHPSGTQLQVSPFNWVFDIRLISGSSCLLSPACLLKVVDCRTQKTRFVVRTMFEVLTTSTSTVFVKGSCRLAYHARNRTLIAPKVGSSDYMVFISEFIVAWSCLVGVAACMCKGSHADLSWTMSMCFWNSVRVGNLGVHLAGPRGSCFEPSVAWWLFIALSMIAHSSKVTRQSVWSLINHWPRQ